MIALVSFAAWFTSEMRPIKGDTRPTAPIDESRPPEGPRPGTPVDLGGEPDSITNGDESRGSSIIGGLRDLFSPAEADAPEPPNSAGPGAAGPSAEELRDHPLADGDEDGLTYSTRRTAPDERPGGEKESIFGLDIFYEKDPDPAPAGATTGPPESNVEPKESDHTRPGADENASDASEPVHVEVDPDGERDSDPTSDDSEAVDGLEQPEPAEASPIRWLREPLNSPRRPEKSPAVETSSPGESVGPTSDVTGPDGPNADTDQEQCADPPEEHETEAASTEDEAADSADDERPPEEPPADHRVEIEDDGSFQFG